MITAHPVRQQKISSIVLAMAACAVVRTVGITVPFLDRALVGREHFGQLKMTMPVFLLPELHVDAMRITDAPIDHVQRNPFQRALRFSANGSGQDRKSVV